MTFFVLTVAAAVVAVLGMAFAGGWSGRLVLSCTLATGFAVAVVARLFEAPVDRDLAPLLVLFATALAVCGGSLAATAVFDLVDTGRPAGDPEPGLQAAGRILRGGAWVGALERLGVFVALVSHLPEGVAIVLAVKGLGRYPELRVDHDRGVAERFIIGTLVSVLWAAGAAYLAVGSVMY